MIIGYDFFGYQDGVVFDSTMSLGSIHTVEVTNSIVDEMHIKRSFTDIYSSDKEDWTVNTLLLAKFQDNLEAGNINLAGQQIELIRIRKRRTTDLSYANVTELPFNKDVQNYNYEDRFVEAGEIYEYAVVPVAFGGFEGEYNTSEVECEFESTWLFNKNEIYKLTYNLDYGAISTVISNTTFEPLGSQYPIIVHNGDLKYKKGNLKTMLVADGSLSGNIDVRQEKLLRNQINNFLTDKKPKILKDGGGNYLLVSITGSPELVANNQLGQRLYDIAFDWTEIGNPYDEATLLKSGLK